MKISGCCAKYILVTLTALARAAAQDQDHVHDACQERLKQLEERVAQLEKVLARLTPAGGEAIAATNTAMPALPMPAQAPDNPKPPMRNTRAGYQPPSELVPEVGKIGAEVGVLVGGSTSPFQLNRGMFNGGFIDLPLFDQPDWMHGKISYEISVGMSESKTTFNTTSNVAQVSNLAVLNALNPNGGLQNVVQAVTGTGSAPFPVVTNTETRLRLLQVVPFSLKYTTTTLDHWRLRPYAILGFGIYVTIHDQNPARGNPPTYGVRPDANIPPSVLATVNSLYGGTSPFGAPLVAGQISQAPELVARGLPGGNGNLDLGLHTGAGVAIRLNRNFSLGFDYRFNQISGSNGGFSTFGSRIGVHF